MEENVIATKPENKYGPWDVAVVGSGPAGLTAAIYTTRGAASTVIFGGEKWGGQLMLTSMVDNFPGFEEGIMGPSLMEKMKNQAVRFGAEFLPKSVTEANLEKDKDGLFEILVGQEKYTARSVIVATGAETRWLGVSGEAELIGRGVSSCAPCDAPFFKDKHVIVVGGGDSAMEEALILTKYASKVTILHRRDQFKASAAMQKKVLENKKITVVWNTEVEEVVGKDKFEKVKIKNNVTGEEGELAADGLFVAIGHAPSTEIFKDKINLDEKGYVVKNDPKRSHTDKEGVFVSGDVSDYTYKQAITAAGYGCQAGMDALAYLDK